ncbi:hypothetical protein EDF39_2147 [Frondihabitans sp. PhB161]|nr:hypothetical protein EDF37_2101 [Frondihabitans sp. PhB153]RPF05444.1 hypothetical protein EDF39_2147 [Frondihabitans sp. PhB161]
MVGGVNTAGGKRLNSRKPTAAPYSHFVGYFDEKIKGKPPALILLGGMFLIIGLFFFFAFDPSDTMRYGLFKGLPSWILSVVIMVFGVGFLVVGLVKMILSRR